ncbi:hypothetical protein FNV43_RR22667 [Rhamnella rubrinervis]|uniref:Uncharacterized protein n=1 Tax=Rhamnella rubrinervis TaxID=2594499 RepID=A0A8K0DUR0_9ROSA|nr:hypothetical protein FNV43_RR22667 [Rhamnella rubrinervis]
MHRVSAVSMFGRLCGGFLRLVSSIYGLRPCGVHSLLSVCVRRAPRDYPSVIGQLTGGSLKVNTDCGKIRVGSYMDGSATPLTLANLLISFRGGSPKAYKSRWVNQPSLCFQHSIWVSHLREGNTMDASSKIMVSSTGSNSVVVFRDSCTP